MKKTILHSIAAGLTLLGLTSIVACGSQEDFLPDESGAEVNMLFNVQTVSPSRSDVSTLTDNERMHNLRIVILHPDGTVEHNRFYALDTPGDRFDILLKVTPSETKQVYFFANEEAVTQADGTGSSLSGSSLTKIFENYFPGDPGFADAVNDLYFQPDYSRNIPMSSHYEVTVPAKGIEQKTFYIVRVATKFTVNFRNWRGQDLQVNELSIASHADRNFLMAHVLNTPQNQALFNGKSWIEWLKDVSDASSGNDSYETTEAAGWLKDYELPSTAQTQTYTYDRGHISIAAATIDTPGTASAEFYLPESKNLKSGATDGEQEYTLRLKIKEGDAEQEFSVALPNLKALFRNTNVVVNITIDKNLEMVVDVIPFTSVSVTPDYGLVKEEFTGYVVGKDANGNKCWYNGNYYDPETAVPLYLGPTDNPGEFVSINGKEYLLVYTDYERTAANLDHFFEKETRKKYLLDPIGRTGYSFTLDPDHPEWGPDIYYNKHQMRVWLNEDYNEWTVGEQWDAGQQKNVEAWFWQPGTTWYRTLNEWDRLNWNQAIYWHWTEVYPKYWFDVLGNRYPWSDGDTKEKRKNKLGEWVQYLE